MNQPIPYKWNNVTTRKIINLKQITKKVTIKLKLYIHSLSIFHDLRKYLMMGKWKHQNIPLNLGWLALSDTTWVCLGTEPSERILYNLHNHQWRQLQLHWTSLRSSYSLYHTCRYSTSTLCTHKPNNYHIGNEKRLKNSALCKQGIISLGAAVKLLSVDI